jgi:D-galactarolactone cycloisomerase
MRENAGATSRIARIRSYHVMCPLPEPVISSQARLLRRDALLVRIETAEGAEGWGECAGFPEMTQTALQTFLGPLAIGRDVFEPDVLWHELWRAMQPWGRRGLLLAGLSGLDMAVWDLRGKLLGLSLSKMMGGAFRDRIPCYATGLYFREVPESDLIPCLIEEAHGHVEAGYRGVKAQIGRNPTFDAGLVRALRKALPHTPLHADAGQAYDLPEAIGIGRLLQDLDFRSFEEPLSLEAPQLYRQLADHISVPLAAGKIEQTRWGFQSILSAGGVAIAKPDPSFCGGPSEALRIRTIAGGAGVNIAPHAGGMELNFATALHLLASDFRLPGRIESSVSALGRGAGADPLRSALFPDAIHVEGGVARVPAGPGIGVGVDPEALKFFCIAEQEVPA